MTEPDGSPKYPQRKVFSLLEAREREGGGERNEGRTEEEEEEERKREL